MRVIKLALLSFFFLFILITLISLFIPSSVRISRAINVYSNPKNVLDPVKNIHQWPNWYPGLKTISPNEINFKRKAGKPVMLIPGSTVIIQTINEHQVLADLVGAKGKKIQNGFNAITHPQTDSITLQWYMDFNLKWYPWEKFGSMLYEKMYGTNMEQGLTNLKELTERNRSSIN
jgi:hypothetical protein